MTADTGIYARQLPAISRPVQLGLAQGRVVSVSFPDAPDADSHAEHDLLDRLERYFGGERDDFADVPVALLLSSPERDVLETLRTVPYGETVRCEQLARMTASVASGNGEATELVRRALRENAVPVFVPTHRVRDGPTGLPDAVSATLRGVEGI